MSNILNRVPHLVATLDPRLSKIPDLSNTFHLLSSRHRSSGPNQRVNTPSTRYGKNRIILWMKQKRSRSVSLPKDTQNSKWVQTVDSPWATLLARERKLLVSTFVAKGQAYMLISIVQDVSILGKPSLGVIISITKRSFAQLDLTIRRVGSSCKKKRLGLCQK